MSKGKKRRKGKRGFEPQGTDLRRLANSKNQKEVEEERPLMLFSFKDFRHVEPGQSYEQWQKDELLAYMLEKFGYICNVNRIEAEQQKFIKVYGDFPASSGFDNPFPEDEDLQWAVIMNIKGQKPRVAGYVKGNVFYVVFLDGEHQFYPSSKKNT